MRTSEFPYYRFPFFEFNKAQAAVIPHITEDVNVAVSFPTATGKTALAEAAFGYHLKQDDICKCIYASPYKSLSSEKHQQWSACDQFSGYGLVLNTGDHVATNEELEYGRLLILTNESLDSKTRGKVNHSWLQRVCCVVIDEAHLIGQEGRGDSLEAALLRFSAINPQARLILLSATMSNVADLAGWLRSLNGKETIKVSTKWRPTKIQTKFFTFETYQGWEQQIALAVNRAQKAKAGEKTIIFVHSKQMGKEIAKVLRSKGVECAFHNASLSQKQRQKIEQAFNDKYSGLDTIVSTSTLSAGVNIG